MENCTKDIRGYKAKTEPTDSLSPYGSKYYGMAFIPEDEYCWPICFCCKREMILILQLRVEDLPEIPADLTFEEGDMLRKRYFFLLCMACFTVRITPTQCRSPILMNVMTE